MTDAMERKAAPEKFFECLWVQGSCLMAGLAVPLATPVVVYARDSEVLWVIVKVYAAIICVSAVRQIVIEFDPSADLSRFIRFGMYYGAFLKLLAILHAIGAIYAGFHFIQKLEMGDDLPMPAWAMGVLIAWMWLVTALAYLAGDAQMRQCGKMKGGKARS